MSEQQKDFNPDKIKTGVMIIDELEGIPDGAFSEMTIDEVSDRVAEYRKNIGRYGSPPFNICVVDDLTVLRPEPLESPEPCMGKTSMIVDSGYNYAKKRLAETIAGLREIATDGRKISSTGLADSLIHALSKEEGSWSTRTHVHVNPDGSFWVEIDKDEIAHRYDSLADSVLARPSIDDLAESFREFKEPFQPPPTRKERRAAERAERRRLKKQK